jgi:hypothetical protein
MWKVFGFIPAAALCIGSSGAAGQAGDIKIYTGMCEPSGAVAFPEGTFGDRFIVANDEDNVLRAYSAAQGGAPLELTGADLDSALKPTPQREADLEGATWLNGKVFWIGSHSRNNDGELRDDRWQFFSTEIVDENGTLTVQLSPTSSLRMLLPAVAERDTLLKEKIALEVDEDRDLQPDKRGFNIEGLTAAADGRSVLIGLRSPLTASNEAIIITLSNPEDVLANGNNGQSTGTPEKKTSELMLGTIFRLDLKRRGIRSIEYPKALNEYLLVAGPIGGSEPYELYRWSGDEGDAPAPIDGSAGLIAAHPDFTPEAMIIDPAGTQVQLLSDDGDRCDEDAPEFRSIVVPIE